MIDTDAMGRKQAAKIVEIRLALAPRQMSVIGFRDAGSVQRCGRFIENLKQVLLRLDLFRYVVLEKRASRHNDVLISIMVLKYCYDARAGQYQLNVVLFARRTRFPNSHKDKVLHVMRARAPSVRSNAERASSPRDHR